MARKVIIALTILLSSMGFSQSLEGIYQLELEDTAGKLISKGTGFLVQHENSKPYIMTSFHLLNSRLLEAENIIVRTQNGDKRSLKITAYDELNDILALSAEGLAEQPFSASKVCNGNLNVVGYQEGRLLNLDAKQDVANFENGGPSDNIRKLYIYLTKGFSGAPVFNSDAEICGMIVLSSEMNASSVAVSASMLKDLLNSIEQNSKAFSIRELRSLMGVEKTVRTQEDLEFVLNAPTNRQQLIVNIVPKTAGETFLIKGGNNAIIEASGGLKRLVIHQSKNIMIRGINIERLIVNESDGITITACMFEQKSKALFLKDSRDVLVSSNVFRNIDTGVVLKSSQVDTASILNSNNFESVQTKIQNI
jgi:S1-C subfamily serine protease